MFDLVALFLIAKAIGSMLDDGSDMSASQTRFPSQALNLDFKTPVCEARCFSHTKKSSFASSPNSDKERPQQWPSFRSTHCEGGQFWSRLLPIGTRQSLLLQRPEVGRLRGRRRSRRTHVPAVRFALVVSR